MWIDFLSWSDDDSQVLAKLPEESMGVSASFSQQGLDEAIDSIDGSDLFVDETSVQSFINFAKENKKEAREGIFVAKRIDAAVDVVTSQDGHVASLNCIGAYGGKALTPQIMVSAIQQAGIKKGINKLALKKALLKSAKLKPGEIITQAIAQGRFPINGKNSVFVSLLGRSKKSLAAIESLGKIDMHDRGRALTVEAGQPLMKREPATAGRPGITVYGEILSPVAGKDTFLKAGKGSEISKSHPDVLVATQSGLPIVRDTTVDVDDVMKMTSIGVESGHVDFNGSVIVSGNIESDMRVNVAGNLIVGGFIESATVEVGGDVTVSKGIIGHNVSEGEEKSCYVHSGGSISAHYAQFSYVKAEQDLKLKIHCLNSNIYVGRDLIVVDPTERQGTVGGGHLEIGNKLICINLGVEGNTPTLIKAFNNYRQQKEQTEILKTNYKHAQERTMEAIRKEMAYKKSPKEQRTKDAELELSVFKAEVDANLVAAKNEVELHILEFEDKLERNTVEVKAKVYPHVTIQFGEEKVTTSKEHDGSVFSFNQYEIKRRSLLSELI
ncbi:FapA family protein [Vibrio sp. FNV 38]|nr:FapA family protein [Vibrio sp. FNV 38]